MDPVVSVVMGSYNHEAYVGEAIESVLRQTYDSWELVVVDDNSTDSSWEVITGFRDPRIRAFRNEHNIGGPATYNAAVGLSTGSVVMSIDSDDAYYPGKMARQVEAFIANPSLGVLGTYVEPIGADGGEFEAVSSWFNTSLNLNDPESWIWQNRLAHSSVAMTRQAHDVIGLEDPGKHRTGDWDMWLRAVQRGVHISVLDEVLTQYRIQDSGVTHADPIGTTIEYLDSSLNGWHDHLRRIGRRDLVMKNIQLSIERLTKTSDDDRDRVLQGYSALLAEPEMFDVLRGVGQQLADATEAVDWLRDQWQRQEQEALRLASEVQWLNERNQLLKEKVQRLRAGRGA